MFLPPDLRDQSSEGFLPGVHLDDPDPRNHFIHDADPAVCENSCLTPVEILKLTLENSLY